MSLFNVFDIAGSAMSAETVRLNVTASNLANAQSVGSSEQSTYHARHPVFAAVMGSLRDNAASAGVAVSGIVESQAPLVREYAPHHAMADDDGYIYRPNVSMVEEMANMISASRAYQNNVEVLNATRQMLSATINLGR